jgi:hypothetical protein
MVIENICEGFISQESTSQWIEKTTQSAYSIDHDMYTLLGFSLGARLSEPETLKGTFAKKTPKKVIGNVFFNIPQTTDKAKYQAKIDALLACFN